MKKKSKKKLLKSKITVNLPHSLRLTRRETSNAIEFEVEVGGSRKGTLYLAQGSVQWRPDSNKKNVHRMWWGEFVDHLEKMPKRRLKK